MKMDASMLLYMMIGILGGIGVGLEGSVNAILGKHIGVLRATIAPFAIGFVAVLIAVAVMGPDKWWSAKDWLGAPWYSYMGGIAAAIFVGSIIYVSPKAGVAAAFSAVLVGQFTTALIIDTTGFVTAVKIPITLWRLSGLALVIVGMRLFFIRPAP